MPAMTLRQQARLMIALCAVALVFCLAVAVGCAAQDRPWLTVINLALAIFDMEMLSLNVQSLRRLPPDA